MPNDSRSIVFETWYPYTLEEVWRALTEAELIARWLMPGDFRAEVGHSFTFSWPSNDPRWQGRVECTVLEVQELRLLSYSWRDSWDFLEPQAETVVTWQIETHGEGTRLTLSHSGFDSPGLHELHKMLSGGWDEIVRDFIPQVLADLRSTGSSETK